MTFGELLKEYRERKHLSKVALAAVIEKTDAYLRKIETDGYTPPVFSLCLKLASALELSEKEKTKFMQTAFIERLHSDRDFYDYIADSTSSLTEDTSLDYTKPDDIQGDISTARCSYYITFYTRSNKKIVTKTIKQDLDNNLRELVSKFGFTLQDLNSNANRVEFLIDVSADVNIQDFVEGLKSQLTGLLKNNHDDLSDYPSLFSHESLIHTVGTCPTKKEISLYKKEVALLND